MVRTFVIRICWVADFRGSTYHLIDLVGWTNLSKERSIQLAPLVFRKVSSLRGQFNIWRSFSYSKFNYKFAMGISKVQRVFPQRALNVIVSYLNNTSILIFPKQVLEQIYNVREIYRNDYDFDFKEDVNWDCSYVTSRKNFITGMVLFTTATAARYRVLEWKITTSWQIPQTFPSKM